MKIDQTKKLRHVAGEHIYMRNEGGTVDMTRVVGLNESAMFLYEKLKDQIFETADITRLLLDEYDVDEATATHDAAEWVKSMKQEGLILD